MASSNLFAAWAIFSSLSAFASFRDFSSFSTPLDVTLFFSTISWNDFRVFSASESFASFSSARLLNDSRASLVLRISESFISSAFSRVETWLFSVAKALLTDSTSETLAAISFLMDAISDSFAATSPFRAFISDSLADRLLFRDSSSGVLASRPLFADSRALSAALSFEEASALAFSARSLADFKALLSSASFLISASLDSTEEMSSVFSAYARFWNSVNLCSESFRRSCDAFSSASTPASFFSSPSINFFLPNILSQEKRCR